MPKGQISEIKEKDIENLAQMLKESKSIEDLNKSFDNITKALNKTCNIAFKNWFDYNFSRYLYYHYIILNENKQDIANKLGIPNGTLRNYIAKYNIKKDVNLVNINRMNNLAKTCQEKYGVDHPGQLPSTHQKRIENIIAKTNGNYTKQYYKKLKKPKKLINKAKKVRQKTWSKKWYNQLKESGYIHE